MSAEPVVSWPRPPVGGYTAEDLDHMPDLPPHTELIDGSLVFVSPQKAFHMVTIDALTRGLDRCAPPDLLVGREMSVIVGRYQRPEPDVVVIKAEAEPDLEVTGYPADAVLLAVEVISPESEERDRHRKPRLYAQAGIPNYWLVEENGNGSPMVEIYELDWKNRAYRLSGIHHGRLTASVPFEIDIDLTPRRPGKAADSNPDR